MSLLTSQAVTKCVAYEPNISRPNKRGRVALEDDLGEMTLMYRVGNQVVTVPHGRALRSKDDGTVFFTPCTPA